MMTDFDICVVGAGPAGMMAAVNASRAGVTTCLLERNSNPGRKLLVTGGGRCNLTHVGSIDNFVKACKPYGHALKPAFYTMSPEETLVFFQTRGLETYIDEKGCIFPTSERAIDVREIMLKEMQTCGVTLYCGQGVISIYKQDDIFVISTEKEKLLAQAVIVATGGVSWPQTGSTGDGYRIAKQFGHSIEPTVGILCPMEVKEPWPGTLQGLSLTNAAIRIKVKSKTTVFTGELVFTADGIGGPVVFDVSRLAAELLKHQPEVPATLDFCPEQTRESLPSTLIDMCSKYPKKDIAGILSQWFPKRLSNFLQRCSCGDEVVQGCHLSKKQRQQLIEALKTTPLTLVRSGSLRKATVTRGGICGKEIDFHTLQSRFCPGLFFAGEVIDVDGPCGGYNLQIAFSTGALAGQSAANNVLDRSNQPC